MPRTRLVDAALMFWTSRDCCRISRETFSGRSVESMMPRTKRKYVGIRSCGVVHDEDAPDVELDAVALLALPQVEWRPRRDEEQLRVLLPALDLGVHARQRRLEVVGDVLVELVVLLVGDLRLGPGPQRRGLVDLLVLVGEHLLLRVRVPRLLLHENGHGDVVRVLAQDLPQPRARQQLVLFRPQVQDDVGAARGLLDRFDRVLAFARALPLHAVVGGQRRRGASAA